MRITDDRLNTKDGQPTWRTLWKQALFRDEIFFVEASSASSGRRVAVHEYPKRNIPYAEDMGRAARTWEIQGYLIGPFYNELRDKLITALEKDGPGRLRLPMPFEGADVQVMVQGYSVQESRDRGGFCGVQMQFVEYGDPLYRNNISTPGEVMQGAANVEAVMQRLQQVQKENAEEMAKYAQAHKEADVPNVEPPFEPSNEQSQDIHSGVSY
jgi:prophage DNA circulation protein